MRNEFCLLIGMVLSIILLNLAEAKYLNPTSVCVASMKRTAVDNPSWFIDFLEDVNKKLEE